MKKLHKKRSVLLKSIVGCIFAAAMVFGSISITAQPPDPSGTWDNVWNGEDCCSGSGAYCYCY